MGKAIGVVIVFLALAAGAWLVFGGTGGDAPAPSTPFEDAADPRPSPEAREDAAERAPAPEARTAK